MAEILVLEPGPDDGQSARWIVVDSNGARLGPPVMGPLSAVQADIADRRVIVLVPAPDVLTTSVDIPLKSPAKIQQALPFALEEMVADDVDDLHFAAGPRRENGRIPVSVVNRERLEGWLDRLHDAGIRPDALVAENYGLASIPGTTSLLVADDCVMINDGGDVELVLQGVTPSEALQAIGALDDDTADPEESADTDEVPAARHVLVYCDVDSEQRFAHEFNALRAECDSLDVKLLPDGRLPRLAVTVGAGAGVNLLQGAYGPRTEYAGYFRPWRSAAVVLLALAVIATGGKAVSGWQLDREEARLQERFLAEYREIAPGASDIRDPVAVISSLRARAGGGTASSSLFLESLEQLGVAMQANAEASINAISYRAGVVDIRVSAPSVAVLDDIQRRIDDSGTFEADIQSTDQDDDKVNSRIQIRTTGS
jgi:general secretion pathway protein L